MKKIRVEDAVGMELCHDITAMYDGFKGAAFKRGHIIREEDVPKLLDYGKQHVFVWEENAGETTTQFPLLYSIGTGHAGFHIHTPEEGFCTAALHSSGSQIIVAHGYTASSHKGIAFR